MRKPIRLVPIPTMREIVMAPPPELDPLATKRFHCNVPNPFTITGRNFSAQVTVGLKEHPHHPEKEHHLWHPAVHERLHSYEGGTKIDINATPRMKDVSKTCDDRPNGDLTITVTNDSGSGLSAEMPNDVTYTTGRTQLSGCLALVANFWPLSLLLGAATKPVVTGLDKKAFECDADNTFTIFGQNFTTAVTLFLEEKGKKPKDHVWQFPNDVVLSAHNGTQITITASPRKHDGTKCPKRIHDIGSGDLTITVTNSDGASSPESSTDVTYFSP
jgi:hypothetical protein